MKRNKGNFLYDKLNDFTVIDLETTGLSPSIDSIIEIAAYKVRNNKIVDTYQQLINPEISISPFISDLTGITNDMVVDKPTLNQIIDDLYDFLKEEILLGHNIHFDLNFLYDNFLKHKNIILNNDYTDTLRISRIVFPEFQSHGLSALCEELNINREKAHRAKFDALATLEIYNICKNEDSNNQSSFEFISKRDTRRAKDFSASYNNDNASGLFKGVFVFTGKLDKMTRKEAWGLVLENNGQIADDVTLKTDYLVFGNTAYQQQVYGTKSRKMKKAQDLILKGHEIKIISEEEFEELISEK